MTKGGAVSSKEFGILGTKRSGLTSNLVDFFVGPRFATLTQQKARRGVPSHGGTGLWHPKKQQPVQRAPRMAAGRRCARTPNLPVKFHERTFLNGWRKQGSDLPTLLGRADLFTQIFFPWSENNFKASFPRRRACGSPRDRRWGNLNFRPRKVGLKTIFRLRKENL
jgi:hypothetical protein